MISVIVPKTLTSSGMSRPNSPLGKPPKNPKSQTLSSRVEVPAPRAAHRSVLAGGGRSLDRRCLDEELPVPDSSFPDSTASSAESAHFSSLSTASSPSPVAAVAPQL
ncbi:unnamed protein product [Phytophthora fragariaefolia]|uniref:Unnamed protein product n=1 Tax=Phytophthora fragariaefolia TaxID=1490495 RepID=A0A9W7CSD4_9STRA|nr:unnamed protein product [Phytophthora fragariaefolia]